MARGRNRNYNVQGQKSKYKNTQLLERRQLGKSSVNLYTVRTEKLLMGWVARGQVSWNYSPLTTMKKKCKKAEWLSEEALQIAEKRSKAKGKGEKERHTHLNAEFQRTARKDKKAFLSEQCKKYKKTIECKRREFSLRKLELPRQHFMQRSAQKRSEMART